jgi:hypothetical protein
MNSGVLLWCLVEEVVNMAEKKKVEEKKKTVQPMVVKKTVQPMVVKKVFRPVEDRHKADLKNLMTREVAHIDKEIERLKGRKSYLEAEIKKIK